MENAPADVIRIARGTLTDPTGGLFPLSSSLVWNPTDTDTGYPGTTLTVSAYRWAIGPEY